MESAFDIADRAGQLSHFVSAIDGVPIIDAPILVKQKSPDFYWYSPILKEQTVFVAAIGSMAIYGALVWIDRQIVWWR